MLKLSATAWWTEADAAELDMLSYELVRAALRHREKCRDCAPGRTGRWCASLTAALETLLDWRESRIRQSKAVWLRERQTDLEALERVAA